MTPSQVRPGRPREFDTAKAIADVTDVFWHKGYSATTLDMLIEQVGLSRSSFYAFFGSKRRAMHIALETYAEDAITKLQAARDNASDPATAVAAMARVAVEPSGGRHGCFMANCTMEIAPVDPKVDQIVQVHFATFRSMFSEAFAELGHHDPEEAGHSVLALTLGLIALRKAGTEPAQLERMVDRGLADIFARGA